MQSLAKIHDQRLTIMRNEIYQEIQNSSSLDHVREGLARVFNAVKSAEKNQRIGVVSGIISSDGDENIERNTRRLEQFTKAVSGKFGIPVFSTADVFGNGMYDKVEEFQFERELREQHFRNFWKMVFETGHITDIFMTPGWERSIGAYDEHEIAKEKGMIIHYLDESILNHET